MRFKYLKVFVITCALFLTFGFVNVNAESLQNIINNSGDGKVVLDQNYTEEFDIPTGKNIILDLNGKTITGVIDVYGTLVVKDSKSGGTIVGKGSGGGAIYVKGGILTLESGTVTNAKGYGIGASNAGKIIVNGGTISSAYAGLTGNNTTGDMYFEVNDGIINTESGPAIYMPGQVSLDVNGGTLNGGISLRMGTINITGGIINGADSSADSVSKYYYRSGNVFSSDALYVLGGTYTSKSGNNLNINITGGTFTSGNDTGIAVAIYDLGKISQNMSVNISKNAKLVSTNKTRGAYDVLRLSDIGITTPEEGFDNSSYVGKVKTNIIGGTFSSINDKYIASGYEKKLVNSNYVVSKKEAKVNMPVIDTNKEVKDVTVGVANYEKVKGVLLASLEESNINTEGKDPEIDISVTKIDENNISSDIKNQVSSKAKNSVVLGYFDISVLVKDAVSGNNIGKLTKLSKKIKFTIALPSNFEKVKAGMNREYSIVRVHNGVVSVIPATLSKDGKYLTFETDRFSTYALVYKDVASSSVVGVKNPQTYDGIMNYVAVAVLTLGAAVGACVYLKKHKFN